MHADLRRTAVHEAGHAIAAFMLGRSFRDVSVEEGDESLGRVRCHAPGAWFQPDIEFDGKTRRRIEDEIVIFWAGVEAEEAVLGDRCDPSARGDIEAITTLALYATGSAEEASAYIEWLRQRSRGLVRHHEFRAAVGPVAAALQQQGRLSARAARRIFNEAREAAVPAVSQPGCAR